MTESADWRRTIGLFGGPAALVLILLSPIALEPPAHRLAAVFGLVIVFWITEAVPLAITALLGPALAVVLGVAGAREAFAGFGHPVIFLFLGSFLISNAMTTHGLDRRIALFVLSRSWVGDRPTRILFAFGLIAWGLSMWMSNTATTAMMLPIGLGVLTTLRAGKAYASGLMLMIAYACNIGGLATPVGSPPNLIALGLIEEVTGTRLSFIEWMIFGLPISIVLFGMLYLFMRRVFGTGIPSTGGVAESIARQRRELGGLHAGERVAALAFLCAVTMWTLPGLLRVVLGAASPLATAVTRALPEGVSALLAAGLLFVVPVDWRRRRFALTWREAAGIDWGTILLFGGGLSLGSLAFSSGLSAGIGAAVSGASGGLAWWLAVLLALLVADGMTEFMSNTATANLLIPIFLAIPLSGGSPILPAIAATLGCSLAFCLPVATPPNAIVYGSGHVPLSLMVRVGIWLDIGAALVAWAILLALSGVLPG